MEFFNERSVLTHGVVFIILDPIFVLARFALRWRTKSWGVDDWFCIPALVGIFVDLQNSYLTL